MRQHTFFQRFGHQGIVILPDEVLSDDPLTDPDTGEELPSLREQVSLVDGHLHHLFCYAQVLQTCGDGLYWADVAATRDFANTWRVILTEEDLYAVLPYDVRVQGKSPAQLCSMMAAHAREVRPVQRVAPAVSTPDLAPVLPLEPLTMVEVSTADLQEALGPVFMETSKGHIQRKASKPVGSFRMQQAFLRVIIDALMTQLYWTQESARTSAIKTQCATVSYLQRWHRQSRQRCVNAVPVWNDEQQMVIWRLTVGDPLSALAATPVPAILAA